MKVQAWGWLGAAVLAAGLNSSYHEGGMQWAHEIADRVEHNTGAVLALATGRADQFLAEARMLNVDRAVDSAKEVEHSRCPFTAAMEHAQTAFDQSQAEFDRFQALSDRQQAKLARLEANRARIEAQVQARLARVRFADNNFTFTDDPDFAPVVVQVPEIRCPRVRVATPHIPRVRVQIPRIHVPSPVVSLDDASNGPI
jgi:hypothetical protein